MIIHGGAAISNYPELSPELEMYQDKTRTFVLTEAWYMLYRNYEEDLDFGTPECLRFSQVGSEEKGRYLVMVEFGDETHLANALIMLESTEGYTSKNQLNYFAEGRNYNFKTLGDPGRCQSLAVLWYTTGL
ncbi:unnamed protein product [Ixodes persulcatus]